MDSHSRSQPQSTILRALFPSKARRALVETLFSGRVAEASVSELARRAGLTARAVAVEVQKLEDAGLLDVHAVGTAHVVRPNSSHPATKALSDLMRASRQSAVADTSDVDVRQSLAAFGAPLLGVKPHATLSLTDTVVRALKAARTDATLLRVLPVVVAKNADRFDWVDLTECARRMNLKAELGMLLDLTGSAANLPNVRAQASTLFDKRRKRQRFFPAVESRYEQKLAEKRSPESATRWHFLMNMTEDSFREMLSKHVHA